MTGELTDVENTRKMKSSIEGFEGKAENPSKQNIKAKKWK